MSSSALETRPDLRPVSAVETIESQIASLRRKMTMSVVIDGLSRCGLILIGIGLISFLADWLFHLDKPQRMVMGLISLVLLVTVVYRRLWLPLTIRPTDDALCLQVEQRNPALGESLINAWQLATRTASPADASGTSSAMRQAAIQSGVTASQNIDFGTVLNQKRFLINVLLLGLAILIFGAASVAANESLSIWFNRNILLGNREWPQDVSYRILGTIEGVITVPRNENWPVEIVVTDQSRRLPSELWLEVQSTGRRERLESLDGGHRFRGELAASPEPLTFRVIEDQTWSEWVTTRPVDRPVLTTLELKVAPPAYTGIETETLPPGGGPYKLLQGSSLSLRGTASKPLSSARLMIGKASVPLTITEGTRLAIDFSPEQLRDGDHLVELTDTEQLFLPGRDEPQPLASREPVTFRIRIGPDREPQIQARLKGIGPLVTTKAMIPLTAQITDDFAVADINLSHRRRGEQEEDNAEGTEPLKSLAALPARSVTIDHVFDLQPLELKTGLSMSIVLEATDNNVVTGPGVGRSTVFLMRVVTDEEFRAALVIREREQRTEFEKRIKQQDDLKTEAAAFQAETRGQLELSQESRDLLARLMKRQKGLGDDLARIARRFEELATEIRQNRIEDERGPIQKRLTEQIVTPLWAISNAGIGDVVKGLEQTRLKAGTGPDRNASLATVITAQQKVLDDMRSILSQMEQAEDFQEAVNKLLEVQKAQQEVLQRTEKEKQEAIKRLLDGAGARPKK